MVSRQTGVSRRTIIQEIKELDETPGVQPGRVRRAGGGRKKTVDTDATLKTDLERLVEPVTRGDPESRLRWTSKSVRKLAEELNRLGHRTSYRMVAELFHEFSAGRRLGTRRQRFSAFMGKRAQKRSSFSGGGMQLSGNGSAFHWRRRASTCGNTRIRIYKAATTRISAIEASAAGCSLS